MFLLYVRLLNRDEKPSSPQRNSHSSEQQVHSANRKTFASRAHQNTVEHLRDVESKHALERRLFN